MIGSVLVGEAKVFRHGKAKTLYVSIPSGVALDSAFTIREGDDVEVKWDKDNQVVTIRAKRKSKEDSREDG
jgi:uncharacterized protein YuzE